MTASALPSSFEKSPLIETVFEVRFSPEHGLASNIFKTLLTDLISSNTGTMPLFDTLEGLQIPQDIKTNNRDLYLIPSYRLIYPKFTLIISDGSIAISQETIYFPYEGWVKFKAHIIKIIDILDSTVSIGAIERSSLKYLDLVKSDSLNNAIDSLNFSASIGNTDLVRTKFDIKFEEDIGDNMSLIVQILSSATLTALKNNLVHEDDKHSIEPRSGLVISIDAICNFKDLKSDNKEKLVFLKRNLEQIHNQSKEKFFSFLKHDFITKLGAKYE